MNTAGTLEVTTPTDREITMTRAFNAPRRLVFDAYTKPELVKRWLGVQNGWTMEVCEIDLRVGGAYRYVWRKGAQDMGMGGEYREIVPSERIVASEKFDDPWYEGEAVGTVTFVEQEGRTTLAISMLYGSKEVRDAILKTPMDQGVAASFDKLEVLLPTLGA